MDVERTIEYILQMQAQSEVRMAKAEERAAKADERMDKFDKRMEAMRKLVETGMRMLVKNEKGQADLTVKLAALTVQVNALTEAQRKSDRKFDRFMESWTKQRTNGHPPKA
jgi:chromosome segregation ATPase